MQETRISLPIIEMIAVTRGMLGVGLGLLIASRLGKKQRVAVGSTLAAIGALSTIPLAIKVYRAARGAQSGRIGQTAHHAPANNSPRAPAEEWMRH
jgi:hypothetical protein